MSATLADQGALLVLAARCEASQAGSRQMDEDCALAAGYSLVPPAANERLPDVLRWVGPDGERNGWVRHPDGDFPPRYTSSLDAASQLVPEAWAVETSFWPHPTEPTATATLRQCTEKRWGKSPVWGHGGDDLTTEGRSKVLALAICAAALRARAAL